MPWPLGGSAAEVAVIGMTGTLDVGADNLDGQACQEFSLPRGDAFAEESSSVSIEPN